MTSTLPAGERTGSALAPMFAPRGIAVAGASRTPGKLGATMARSLASFADDGGHLALVNGRDETMHPSLSAATGAGPVDLAMICVPAAACPGVLAEAAQAGVRAAVICGGGFAEAGGAGVEHQEAVAQVVRETGIRVPGPDTSGFLAPHAGVMASFVPGVAGIRPGRVAVAASGGVNHAVSFLLTEAGHGISLAVGLGNGVDAAAPDILDYLAEDPHTGAVALHVEPVADGPGVGVVTGYALHEPGAVNPAEAAAMPDDLAGRALPEAWRGGPVLDAKELGAVVSALGHLLVANPGLDEIEINPLRLTRDGLVALDAVIIPREADDAQPDQ